HPPRHAQQDAEIDGNHCPIERRDLRLGLDRHQHCGKSCHPWFSLLVSSLAYCIAEQLLSRAYLRQFLHNHIYAAAKLNVPASRGRQSPRSPARRVLLCLESQQCGSHLPAGAPTRESASALKNLRQSLSPAASHWLSIHPRPVRQPSRGILTHHYSDQSTPH